MTKEEIYGFKRLTLNAIKILNIAYDLAKTKRNTNLEPIHLFLAMLNDVGNISLEVLHKVGIDIDSTKKSINEFLEKIQTSKTSIEPKFSNKFKDLMAESFKIASSLGHVYVGSEHFLLAFFALDIDFIQPIKNIGIDFNLIKNTVLNVGNYFSLNTALNSIDKDFKEESLEDNSDFLSEKLDFFANQKYSSNYSGQFYTDMNKLAEEGRFSNITGRDQEIKRLIHILSRKTKNNPILVGDAGVGKTAIVEGFVNLIIQKKVPPSFFNKRVISLDIASILSGSRLRGDIEERIMQVIDEVIEDQNTIIFIDEIHMIVGAGSSGTKDSIDLANLLKPYLTDSEVSVIGATTYDEYSKYFEVDSALSRRFQPIKVKELSVDASKKILLNLKAEFEEFHNVKIPNSVIELAVDLTNKFIKDRYLPDKAIDVIDEACASLRIGYEYEIQPQVSNLAKKLIEIQNQKDELNKKKDFEKALILKNKEEKLLKQIENIMSQKNGYKNQKNIRLVNKSKPFNNKLNEDLIKNVIYDWTQISVVFSNIQNKTFRDLFLKLRDKIVGQDHVLDKISRAIQKSHLGLNNPNKPLASFMFLGPTGVGKTATAKVISKEVFGSENLLIQVNMSEFMESHSVAKLIGAPPGYVGYQEGGILTNFIKRNPYSVVLFDEVEKAHPDVLNILLQILDEGVLVDSKGLKTDFKNTIIILTSNIGADFVSNDNKLGFDVVLDGEKDNDLENTFFDMRNRILEELKKKIKIELINRIDVIEVFRGLNKFDSEKISKILLDDLKVRLLSVGIYIEFDDSVVKKVNEIGYSKIYGVRNLNRTIQENIENVISDFLLNLDHQSFSNKKYRSKYPILKLRIIFDNNLSKFIVNNIK